MASKLQPLQPDLLPFLGVFRRDGRFSESLTNVARFSSSKQFSMLEDDVDRASCTTIVWYSEGPSIMILVKEKWADEINAIVRITNGTTRTTIVHSEDLYQQRIHLKDNFFLTRIMW